VTTSVRQARGYSALEVLIVLAVSTTVAAIAIPMSGNALGFYRLSGDARKVSNGIAVTKMRAASDFTQARLYFDRTIKRFHMETYQKTGTPAWVWAGGTTDLSQGVSLGFGSIATPPPNTQAAIDQAPECRTTANAVIANTSCIVFNSRGIPIDSGGTPTPADAIYLTDGTGVYGITVIASGMIQVWRTPPSSASWAKQ